VSPPDPVVEGGPGNNTSEQNLAEFLFSWFAEPSPIDSLTIIRFATRMAQITGRWSDLMTAWEMACVLSNRYPIMNAVATGAGNQYVANTFASIDTQNYAGLRPTQAAGNFPQNDPGKWDFVVPNVSPMWFSQMMMGVIETKEMGKMEKDVNFWVVPFMNQYARYVARTYAVTMQVFHRMSGIPAGLLNALYAQTNYIKIKETYKNLWIQNAPGTTVGRATAPLGKYIGKLMSAITGYRPRTDRWDYCMPCYLNTPQGGTAAAPGNGFAGVYDGTPVELTNVIPSIIADIWFLMNARKFPKAMQTWPVPVNKPCGLTDSNHQVMAWAAGGKSTPVTAVRSQRNYGTNSLPVADDIEIFNARLAWHGLNGQFFTTDGNAFAVSVPAVNTFVTQRRITPDFTLPNYVHSRIATANTNWIPFLETGGLMLTIGVTNANGADLMTQVMAGRAFTSIESYIWPGREIMPNTIIGGEDNDASWLTFDKEEVNSDTAKESPSS
jgi:hypothetical protein